MPPMPRRVSTWLVYVDVHVAACVAAHVAHPGEHTHACTAHSCPRGMSTWTLACPRGHTCWPRGMPTWVYVDTPRAHVDSLTTTDVHVAIQGRLPEEW